MSASWIFYPQESRDTIRNPISSEFFSTEAVGDVTEALIREGIQNVLDARKKRPDGARERANARIFLSETAGALSPTQWKRWFDTIWPHITAPDNGLRSHPDQTGACPFLVFEDFGTTGLTGSAEDHEVKPNVVNHFLNFFRAEGHSDKREDDRGSWGVGKTVFPSASKISSFFGLTVRNENPTELLLGRSILKYHRVKEKSFKSDGYFGIKRHDGFMLPTADAVSLAAFRRDFKLKRTTETGLSLIIPWYDTAGDDAITREKAISAILHGFYYPILMGHLAVTVATPTAGELMLSSSIIQQVESMRLPFAKNLLPWLELAEWANTRTHDEILSLKAPDANDAQKWSPDLVPENIVKYIRTSLEQRQRIALRVPMYVQPRAEQPLSTYFTIFMEYSENDSETPTFIRDELIIPRGGGGKHVSHLRALVIAENKPIAGLLRDAEKPAHDEWSAKTGNFKDKYKFGPGAIRFVQSSVSSLMSIVNQAEAAPDPSVTIDYFSVPATDEDNDAIPAKRRQIKQKDGFDPLPKMLKIPPGAPRRFRIFPLHGGFRIARGQIDAGTPDTLFARVSYDVRRGNPFKKYHAADFDVSKQPIRCEIHDQSVELLSSGGNRMLLRVLKPDFKVDITGFDPDRDLKVEVKASREATDGE